MFNAFASRVASKDSQSGTPVIVSAGTSSSCPVCRFSLQPLPIRLKVCGKPSPDTFSAYTCMRRAIAAQTIDSQKPHTGVDSPILLSQQAVQELQICIDFVHQFLRGVNLLGGKEEGALAPQLKGTCTKGQILGTRGIVDLLSHIQMFKKPPFSRWA